MTTLEDIKTFTENALARWGLNAKGWKFDGRDKRNRSLGLANRIAKTITVNKDLFKESKEIWQDVCLHEVAHAYDWENFKGWSHGKSWKAACVIVGANPKATMDSSQVSHCGRDAAKYVLRHIETKKIFATYMRKPKISNPSKVWMTGRKEETFGKLELVKIN